MRQGEQGQTEGCRRCDGNRTDLGTEKVYKEALLPTLKQAQFVTWLSFTAVPGPEGGL